MSLSIRTRPLTEQEALVVRLKDKEKLTHGEIGQRLGVSGARAQKIYSDARERLKDFARHGEESLFLLPKRARNIVQYCKLKDRAQVRAAIESGRLWWRPSYRSICLEDQMLRNVGPDTWVVLHEWARLPAPWPASTAAVENQMTEAEFDEALKDPAFMAQLEATFQKMAAGESGENTPENRALAEAVLKPDTLISKMAAFHVKYQGVWELIQHPPDSKLAEQRLLAALWRTVDELTDMGLNLPEPYRTSTLKKIVPLRKILPRLD